MLNIARALPQHHHVLLFDNYQPSWVAAELRQRRNVTLLSAPNRKRALTMESPDILLYHFYPPMSVHDFTDLPSSLASRTFVYNHWHTPVPHIPRVEKYCFPSPSSARLSGKAIPKPQQTVIINPVADEFFRIRHRKGGAFRMGRHSRGVAIKFSSDFFKIFEQIDIPDLQVLSLGHVRSMTDWLTQHASALKHTYWLLTANTMPVRRFLSTLDLYVYKTHPAFRETCPVAILEALASGIPVIGENRGGIADLVVEGETGFLCRTQKDYKNGVEALYADAGRRRQFSLAAREWAREHASLKVFGKRLSAWLNLR